MTDPCPKTDFGSHDKNQTTLWPHIRAGGVATPASVIRDSTFKEDEEGRGVRIDLFFISMVSPSPGVRYWAEQYRGGGKIHVNIVKPFDDI